MKTACLVAVFVAFFSFALSVAMRDLAMALLWWGGFNAAFIAWCFTRAREKRP